MMAYRISVIISHFGSWVGGCNQCECMVQTGSGTAGISESSGRRGGGGCGAGRRRRIGVAYKQFSEYLCKVTLSE